MTGSELPALYEVAARASVNERCALAYLHDVRGSMQALFSAIELLGRAAKSAGCDPSKIDKACELARRAMGHHEKSTLEVLQRLTLQPAEPSSVDVAALVKDVAQFLRNEAAVKQVVLQISSRDAGSVVADRAALHCMLSGLLVAAIEDAPAGSELSLSADRIGDEAVISIAPVPAWSCSEAMSPVEVLLCASPPPGVRGLTLLLARQMLRRNGGRLEFEAEAAPGGRLRLFLA
jgi:signal transduction histidine kinase